MDPQDSAYGVRPRPPLGTDAYSDVTHPLGALVLDRNFNSLSQVGRHWPRRLELIRLRLSTPVAQIDDGSVETQNIWLHTLEQIFNVFGVTQPPMFDVTKAGYIREVVEARNKIAHGEDSPLVYGSLKRSTELQLVHDAIRTEAFDILDCFNDYVDAQAHKLMP
jgi:RiboL-PSP-HEPN